MKIQCLSIFILFHFLIVSGSINAQDNSNDDSSPKRSYFKLGVNYINDNVYLGRKDSVKVPYLTPSIGYYSKSGFYITGSFSYLPSSGESRIDVFNLEAGYDFTIKKLEGEIYINKDFYNAKSFSVKSELSANATANFGYDIGFIKPSLGGSINFGSTNDYALTGGLNHSFSLNDDKLSISPAINFNASTQNYYNSYYQKRKYANSRKGKNGGYDITAIALNVNNFKIMDYELSVPFEYTVNKITLNFTPTYAIPTNPNQVVLDVKSSNGGSYTKTYTEKLANTFFWSFEISYKF